MKKISILTFLFILLTTSCANLQQVAGDILKSTAAGTGVSNTQNIAGLKDALSVGITNAVLNLNQPDGYLNNQLLKIFLPDEAKVIVDNLKYIPGGQKMVDDVVLRLNRAASDAAAEAKPIFVNAIKNMTITDAANILFSGDKSAATTYLKDNTYNQLVAAYSPKIEASLGKSIVAGVSAAGAWNTLSGAYNSVANSVVGKAAKLTPVNGNLSEYVTRKALDGLFLSVANEEAKIRQDPTARVNDLLKTVFGQLDKK